MLSLTALSRPLSTSEDSVSSTRILAPWRSGPKAQMDRAARRSHSYFSWKNAPTFLRGQSMLTVPASAVRPPPHSLIAPRHADAVLHALCVRLGGAAAPRPALRYMQPPDLTYPAQRAAAQHTARGGTGPQGRGAGSAAGTTVAMQLQGAHRCPQRGRGPGAPPPL